MIEEPTDSTGGWLRPAVFGAMDGLVSNFSLIMGVAGGTAAASAGSEPIILAGLAGLAAGAFSMAAGEYTSVASQAEYSQSLVELERAQIIEDQEGEQEQLAGFFVNKGIDIDASRAAAAQIHDNLDDAVRVHSLEEYGVDMENLPSPTVAALSSFVAFAVGAVLPIMPYLVGVDVPLPSIIISLVALFGCGAIVTAVTNRPWWYGGTRQLLLGGIAALVTYWVGVAVGSTAF